MIPPQVIPLILQMIAKTGKGAATGDKDAFLKGLLGEGAPMMQKNPIASFGGLPGMAMQSKDPAIMGAMGGGLPAFAARK